MPSVPFLGGYGDLSGSGLMFRNKLINGDMRIDQRNAGASYSAVDGGYSLDRWRCGSWDGTTQTGKFSIRQNLNSVGGPAGFSSYLGIVSNAATSVGTVAEYLLSQFIEGQNCADLAWGTPYAKQVTVSFWVRSSLTGPFGGALLNSNVTRSYPFSYTISSANTWEYKTVTISGDTSGTWLTDTGIGIRVVFGLGVGSTKVAAAGSWYGANYFSATGATNVVATNGATLYVTGVQLEAGPQATPFEQRPIGTELDLCRRYCQVFPSLLSTMSGLGSTTTRETEVRFNPNLRATPADANIVIGTLNEYTTITNKNRLSSNSAASIIIEGTVSFSSNFGEMKNVTISAEL